MSWTQKVALAPLAPSRIPSPPLGSPRWSRDAALTCCGWSQFLLPSVDDELCRGYIYAFYRRSSFWEALGCSVADIQMCSWLNSKCSTFSGVHSAGPAHFKDRLAAVSGSRLPGTGMRSVLPADVRNSESRTAGGLSRSLAGMDITGVHHTALVLAALWDAASAVRRCTSSR